MSSVFLTSAPSSLLSRGFPDKRKESSSPDVKIAYSTLVVWDDSSCLSALAFPKGKLSICMQVMYAAYLRNSKYCFGR